MKSKNFQFQALKNKKRSNSKILIEYTKLNANLKNLTVL